jgi:hypothetical protein
MLSVPEHPSALGEHAFLTVIATAMLKDLSENIFWH